MPKLREEIRYTKKRIYCQETVSRRCVLAVPRTVFFFFSVGLPVAKPRMYCSHVAYCTTLNVQTLTTSRLTKRSWQSEVELNLIIFRRSNFYH